MCFNEKNWGPFFPQRKYLLKISTMEGSNCVPDPSIIRLYASSGDRAERYALEEVIASKASAIATILAHNGI